MPTKGDSSDRSRIKVRTVEAAAKRIFRTETVNPKFIEGLMQHGYKGAADLSNRVAVMFPVGCDERCHGGLDV